MTIRLEEVVRSEVDGGLSGPANPIPNQSIDCGCAQLPCPKLAKFATRRLFVGLMCWVGLVQAASAAYFYIAGGTIARRFNFDPLVMDWILVVSDLVPFFVGSLIAYWGDRVHRMSWVGGLVLLQSAGYFLTVIPHFTHRIKVIEETLNVTHMSLYADDSPELCTAGAARIVIEETEPCYTTLVILIGVQILTGLANVAYYALGISYLDDNTKKRHVAAYIGVILAVKIIGVLLGYFLAWGCLRIDAETFKIIESYQEQVGAWWLGFPILAILLVIPGLLLSWFPRRLPSEVDPTFHVFLSKVMSAHIARNARKSQKVVEQAAATLLGRGARYNRGPHRTISQKVGSPSFWPSFVRLLTNRLLMCNILASVFTAMAILNFIGQENIILESRFYVPRPTGMLLGFGDPMSSRLVSNILKPILIGFVVIITGLVLARGRPGARYITGHSIVVTIMAAVIILCLALASCKKVPIVGMEKGSFSLLKYCNKDCRCSPDADFRPVCDSQGTFTFYSPCHAGCAISDYVNGMKVYSDCSCVREMIGEGNEHAKDGPCDTKGPCQVGWLAFEFGTLFAYALIASGFVGDLLLGLRSVYKQDKALCIGFWMSWMALLVNVPGKLMYQLIADKSCNHWGNKNTICRLHDSDSLGNYMCYLTGLLLGISVIFKVLVWFFCKNTHVYNQPEIPAHNAGAELQELVPSQTRTTAGNDPGRNMGDVSPMVEIIEIPQSEIASAAAAEEARKQEEQKQKDSAPLKYGPIGPGDRRNAADESTQQSRPRRPRVPRSRNHESDDELESSSDESKKISDSPVVAYRPLEIDSDVESDLGSTGPRSRKRVLSKDYDQIPETSEKPEQYSNQPTILRQFPNPDDYGDPRSNRLGLDGSSKTSSFEFSKGAQDKKDDGNKGDFNEVGIPVVDPLPGKTNGSKFLKDVKSLIDRYEHNTSPEDRGSVKSDDKGRSEGRPIAGIPLVAMVSGRPTSRGQSSGFGSLQDVQEKAPTSSADPKASPVSKASSKGSKSALCTDL